MARLLPACAAALAGLGVVAGAAQAAPSLVYVAGGDVWAANLATGDTRQLTTAGGLSNVSAADDGRILAVKTRTSPSGDDEKSWLLMRPDGTVISEHLVDLGECPSLNVGPLAARIDPSGSWVAFGTSCSGFAGQGLDLRVVVNPVDQASTTAEPQSGYRSPTWFGRRLVTEDGGDIRVQQAANAPFTTSWDDWVGSSITQVEISRDGALAFGIGPGDSGITSGVVLRLDAAGSPGAPTAGCNLTVSPESTRPVVSPDGRWIAYRADTRGVAVSAMPDLPPAGTAAIAECPPGASGFSLGAGTAEPSFTADDDFAGGGGGVAFESRGTLKGLARGGMALTVTTPGAGRVSATVRVSRTTARGLRLQGRTVATGATSAAAAGSATVRLKTAKKAKRALRRASSLPATVAVRFAPASGQPVTATAKVAIR